MTTLYQVVVRWRQDNRILNQYGPYSEETAKVERDRIEQMLRAGDVRVEVEPIKESA